MRILLLAPHPFFQARGTPIAVREVIDALGQAGHLITLLAYHEGEDLPLIGCRLLRIPRVWGTSRIRPGFSLKKVLCDVAMMGSSWRLCRSEPFDLVHAVEESAAIAWVLQKRFGMPYVYDMDSSLVDQLVDRFPFLRTVRWALAWLEGVLIRGSVGVVAVCPAVEQLARRAAPQHLVSRVEDSTLLRSGQAQSALAIPAGPPAVMYVGNLEPYQGMDLLLEGFAIATQRLGVVARLVVVGGTPAAIQMYRTKATALGVGGCVLWLGAQPVELLGALLGQAEVVVSPRIRGQNTPMKIYSYLDCGRALLATRLPTHLQVLDDDVACLVSPNPDTVAGGIERLLSDPQWRTRLATAARARVDQCYTREHAISKLRSFYATVQHRLSGELSS